MAPAGSLARMRKQVLDRVAKGEVSVVKACRRYERKLWMRDLVMGVAYPPVDH